MLNARCNTNVPKTSLFNKFLNDWIHGFQDIGSIIYKNGWRYHPLSQRRKRQLRPQILQQRRWRPEAAWRWKRLRPATSKHIAQPLNANETVLRMWFWKEMIHIRWKKQGTREEDEEHERRWNTRTV